jgi:acetoin utilization deacetylase AcuC-like enzyme
VAGITTDVLARREELVFSWAATHAIPVAWTLAGGYASSMGSAMGMQELAELHAITTAAAVRHSIA